MKKKLLYTLSLIALVFTMNSCSSDESNATTTTEASTQKVVSYTYSSIELETMDLINKHRISVGL
ncbi:hypothetical protein IQ02_02833, partial [Flavobacterium glaciei]